ncbi:MAG: glycosyltransferase family 2 protein [Opitutaceae bacterium]|nr:glycosyltransferase family 2 protein [Cytophagales bacterium]
MLFTAFYAYLGYGIVIYILDKLKKALFPKSRYTYDDSFTPNVTLLIAAYNEADFIEQKLQNCFQLIYPKDKLEIFFVTDGSDDATPDIISRYPNVKLFHEPGRAGKINAVNRIMPFVKTPVVIFCDANTLLNPDALSKMARHFSNPKVGCVAGEKKVLTKEKDSAAAGEGIYWKYESFLKKLDSSFNTVVGAAGELFAMRTELFHATEKNAIIEDFVISLRIAGNGYKVVYEPEAYAMESSSANVQEELKRKIRICAGGIQSIVWLAYLLNPFKYGWLTFQYISHRVLRWSLVPLFMLFLIPLNIILAKEYGGIYAVILLGQLIFYSAALIGWFLEHRSIKVKALFVPYYFFIMNYAVFLGFKRYIKGQQSVLWERAKRA